ncbi:MAG: hypothetical protein Q7J85_04040 [Bacillota bacterium]|nr:hypothetical protein [Bacillota bacterium]
MRGSIRSQLKGSWQVRLYIDGKQKSYTVKGKKADAQRFLNELLHKLETGTYIEPTKMTLAEYLSTGLKILNLR